MQTLPVDVLKQIFLELSSKQRSEICTVCKLWEHIAVGFVNARRYYSDYHSFVRSKLPVDLAAACEFSDIDLVIAMLHATPNNIKHEKIYSGVVTAFTYGNIPIIGYILAIADNTLTKAYITCGILNHYSLGLCIYESLRAAIQHDQIHVLEYLEISKHLYSNTIIDQLPSVSNIRYLYSRVCNKCKVSTLEYLESNYAEGITEDVLSDGLSDACEGNMEVVKYLVPRVQDLSSAFHSACGDENIEVINYLNQFSDRTNYDTCYDWCGDNYFDTNYAEMIVKYAVRPISQQLIRRSFTRACEFGDYAAMAIVDWLDPVGDNDTIILDGFYKLCKIGRFDVKQLCNKYNFSLEQLQHGLSLMPVETPDMWPQIKDQIIQARSSLEAIINDKT